MIENAAILGSGIYLPKNVLRNDELEEMLSLEKGFIESHTGILERRWPDENETLGFMASQAATCAVRNSGVQKIDRILVSRDVILTNRAYSLVLYVIQNLREEGVNVDDCFSIDISNYCPGVIHAVNIASLMVGSNQAENVLVVASTRYADMINLDRRFNEAFESGFNPESDIIQQFSVGLTSQGRYQAPKLNAFLWGNGAGALVVGRSTGKGRIMAYDAKGSAEVLYDSYGIGEDKQSHSFASLDGTAIYKFGVKEVPKFIEKFLRKYGVEPEQIDSFIPHQPNPRILQSMIKNTQISNDRMEVSCDTLGNMIGASIPITYHLAKERGKIKQGDHVLMCSFGDSYLTASALFFRED